MQKYIVPQFIDVENKILGPITVRQFATIAVAGVFVFVAYRLADFSLFIIEAIIIAGVTAIIGFFRFNGLPFHIFILNVIGTYKKPMLRVWLKDSARQVKERAKKKRKKGKVEDEDHVFIPKKSVSSAKLSELALIIDTGGIYKGEAEANRVNKSLYEE